MCRRSTAHLGRRRSHSGDDVNIGVAVAMAEGLIVPVVRQADQQRLAALAAALEQLSQRAWAGQLTPADVQEGTFTISNLGMYGVDSFTAIINPPQAAILAVGQAVKQIELSRRRAYVNRTAGDFHLDG